MRSTALANLVHRWRVACLVCMACSIFLVVRNVSYSERLSKLETQNDLLRQQLGNRDAKSAKGLALDKPQARFSVVCTGSGGGVWSNDLSGYLLGVLREGQAIPHSMIAMEAGSILWGIDLASQNGVFDSLHMPADDTRSRPGYVLQEVVKAYFLGHPHLDHNAGLHIASTDDKEGKPVYGLDFVLGNLSQHVFNWMTWPNLADSGDSPVGRFHWRQMQPTKEVAIPSASLAVTPYVIQHGDAHGLPYYSSAFLVRQLTPRPFLPWTYLRRSRQQDTGDANGDADAFCLYLSDLGPDSLQGCNTAQKVWEAVAPLVTSQQLRGIFMEASFPSDRPDHLLFGHLTPCYMLQELRVLASIISPEGTLALQGITVFVTHVKPTMDRVDMKHVIWQELQQEELDNGQGTCLEKNNLGCEFIVIEQGKHYKF